MDSTHSSACGRRSLVVALVVGGMAMGGCSPIKQQPKHYSPCATAAVMLFRGSDVDLLSSAQLRVLMGEPDFRGSPRDLSSTLQGTAEERRRTMVALKDGYLSGLECRRRTRPSYGDGEGSAWWDRCELWVYEGKLVVPGPLFGIIKRRKPFAGAYIVVQGEVLTYVDPMEWTGLGAVVQ